MIDMVVMDRIVRALNERHPECDLTLKHVETIGTPHATFTVVDDAALEEAKRQLTTDYEMTRAALKGRERVLLDVMSRYIDQPQLLETHGSTAQWYSSDYEKIVQRMEEQTRTLSDVCQDHDLPSLRNWYRYVKTHPELVVKMRTIRRELRRKRAKRNQSTKRGDFTPRA